MCSVNDGFVIGANQYSWYVSYKRSYIVCTETTSGARFGGATTTQAGSTGIERPSISTVADTGPSDTSSCQPSLLANVYGVLLGKGVLETPRPPRKSRLPRSSVRS